MNQQKPLSLDEAIGREQVFKEKSDLTQAFEHIDRDEVNPSTSMSSIDMNARLNKKELSGCLRMDELLGLRILPLTCRLSRQKKRLSASLDGQGRQEKVTIATANMEQKSGVMGGNWLKRMFTPRA